MRPLPDLTPLSPSPTVYDSTADSFLSLFGDNLNQQNSLTGKIAAGHDTLATNIDPLYTMLNEIVNALGTIIKIFDQLSNALDAVNLLPDIASYQALDSSLEGNLDSWAPNLGQIADVFLSALSAALAPVLTALYNAVVDVIQTIADSLMRVLNMIETEFANLLAEIMK